MTLSSKLDLCCVPQDAVLLSFRGLQRHIRLHYHENNLQYFIRLLLQRWAFCSDTAAAAAFTNQYTDEEQTRHTRVCVRVATPFFWTSVCTVRNNTSAHQSGATVFVCDDNDDEMRQQRTNLLLNHFQ